MEVKVGILMLFVLVSAWSCDAINSVSRINSIHFDEEIEVSIPAQLEKSEPVCTYCEQSVARAMQYLSGNNTQQQIFAILHASCSRLKSFADECSKVVDYYAPMFFFELSIIQPDDICQKANLCEIMNKERESILSGHNICNTCRQKVSDILYGLKERDTQLAYIETVKIGCKSMPIYLEKCVPMAYELVPQVIRDLENFLGASDICATYFGCTAAENDNAEAFALEGEPLLSET
ncbi:hypothetical protein QQ045_003587 [Rhodiola kirilowii]